MEYNYEASAPTLDLILEDLGMSYEHFKATTICVPALDESFDDYFQNNQKKPSSKFWKKIKIKFGKSKSFIFAKSYNRL